MSFIISSVTVIYICICWLFYCGRVEAQEKMIILRDRAEKDVQQHNAEMKELIRIIDHDRRLREFMNAKSREREEDRQLVAWRLRKGWSSSLLF